MIDVYCDSSVNISSFIIVANGNEYTFRKKHDYIDSSKSELYGILFSLEKLLIYYDIIKDTKINVYCDSTSALSTVKLLLNGGKISHHYKNIINRFDKKRIKKLNINLNHMYGHSGMVYIDMCDRLCRTKSKIGQIIKNTWIIHNNGYIYSVDKQNINKPMKKIDIYKSSKPSIYDRLLSIFSGSYNNIIPKPTFKLFYTTKMVKEKAYFLHLEDNSRTELENWLLAEKYYKQITNLYLL